MGNHGQDQDSSFEIEVSPLHPRSEAVTGEPASAKPLLASTRPRHDRLRRGIGVTSALVVILVALSLSITPTREALRGAVFGPTPTATAPVRAGEDNLYVSVNPYWGVVTLDDKPLAHLPIEGVDQPLHLTRGVHMLRWRYAPIIDFSCRLTVPSTGGGACPTHTGVLPGEKGIASVVRLQLSLANLMPAYRESLMKTIQRALDSQRSSETVRTGERYIHLSQSGGEVVANHPLQATLNFVSDAENPLTQCPALQQGLGAQCGMIGDCRELCAAPWQIGQPPQAPTEAGGVWTAYIVAHASWRYTTLDGRVVAENQPDIGGSLQFLGNDERPLPVTIGWDGSQWQVHADFDSNIAGSPFGDPACMTAQDEVTYQGFLPPELPGQIGGGFGVAWLYVPGAPRAIGCLAAALPKNAQGAPDTSAHGMAVAGLILHRFGVPIAANAAAHRYWPDMPVADAYEQAIALNLAQRLPGLAGVGQ